MTWPYVTSVGVTDYNSLSVGVVDNSSKRFFSGMIDQTAKKMNSAAVTTVKSSSGGATTVTASDACIMTLGGDIAIFNPYSGTSSNCTLIADNANITLTGDYVTVAGTAYTTGSVVQSNYNPGRQTVANKMEHQPVVADPYASYLPATFAPAYFPNNGYLNITGGTITPCNDVFDGTYYRQVALSANGDATSMGNTAQVVDSAHPTKTFTWRPATQDWYITGGARFCNGISFYNNNNLPTNGKITFGPGMYIIESAANWNYVTIDTTAGATIALGNMQATNWGFSTANLAAPPAGTPMPSGGPGGSLATGIAGIALMTMPLTVLPSNGFLLAGSAANPFALNFSGDIYMPNWWIQIQSYATMSATTFVNGISTASGSTACGRAILKTFQMGAIANVGNNCNAAIGVKPFGTPTGAGGWPSTGTAKMKPSLTQ